MTTPPARPVEHYLPIAISTTFGLPGTRITRYCGACFGVTVRSLGLARGVGASFRALAGGEVGQYTTLLEDSRRHAIDRMIGNAQALGANAVVGMRFDSSEIGQGLTEIVAYGTAVVVTPDNEAPPTPQPAAATDPVG